MARASSQVPQVDDAATCGTRLDALAEKNLRA